jgi:TRAP-type C4-dicarboxylate transport system permease small subunit
LRIVAEIAIRLVVLAVAACMIYYGCVNFMRGFGSFRLPSNTPIASLYAAIPMAGVLVALFTLEQIVNGLRNGFEHVDPEVEEARGAFEAATLEKLP